MARVTWSPTARADLEANMNWLARETGIHTALKWTARIQDSVQVLEQFPEIGAPVEESPARGYRERLIGRYRVIYRFDGDTCWILHVVRTERDLRRAIQPEGDG